MNDPETNQKSAKQLFEEIGFKEWLVDDKQISFVVGRKVISFYHESKNYMIFDDRDYTTPVPVEVEWHKAITKKLKELGWI